MLSFLMMARKGVFVAFTISSISLMFAGLRWLRRRDPCSLKSVPPAMRLLFITGFLVYAALYLRQALTPEAGRPIPVPDT
jgi:hypothetical protein